ncbi:MAG TPA: tRNA (adenine-N1)-methyltransferase [Candidatus Thermoplasmatota archaeon]
MGEQSRARGAGGARVAVGDVVLVRWPRGEALAEVGGERTRVGGLGVFNTSTLAGTPYGGSLTVGAQSVRLLRPAAADFVRLLRRSAQVITLKDAGAILTQCSIGAGARVVEFGVGSGSLTIVLLHAVGPAGRVLSVDNQPKHIESARRNVGATPWAGWWELREGDAAAGVGAVGADAVVMDLPEPWAALPAAREALGPCGRLASFSPTINQAERVVLALEEAGFADVRTVELLERAHAVRRGATRPEFDMLGHTGYLTFARRLD